jgi:hypothetical protein
MERNIKRNGADNIVVETPCETMGYRSGEDKIMQVPLAGSAFTTTHAALSPMQEVPHTPAECLRH